MRNCNQCGKCCINYSDGGLSATKDEIEFWEIFRPEIYRFVQAGKIWMDPATGKQLSLCPWLKKSLDNKYNCEIYHDRPEDCKQYPITVSQMVQDECEMLESKDLKDAKRAQVTLDKLMFASRTP